MSIVKQHKNSLKAAKHIILKLATEALHCAESACGFLGMFSQTPMTGELWTPHCYNNLGCFWVLPFNLLVTPQLNQYFFLPYLYVCVSTLHVTYFTLTKLSSLYVLTFVSPVYGWLWRLWASLALQLGKTNIVSWICFLAPESSWRKICRSLTLYVGAYFYLFFPFIFHFLFSLFLLFSLSIQRVNIDVT